MKTYSPTSFAEWGLLLFGSIWLILGVTSCRYERAGITVDGVVVSKQTGRDAKNLSNYYIEYRFVGPDGQARTGTEKVLGPFWRSLQEGGPVPVQYMRDDPSTHRIPGQVARANVWFAMTAVAYSIAAWLHLRHRLRAPADP
jgi:hypothetical protein